MTDLWTQFAGVAVAGKYPLGELLANDEHSATFRTHVDSDPARPAVLTLVRLGTPAAEQRLRQWEAGAALDHPHILRVLETGRSTAGDSAVAYAVMEHPDENLGTALRDRPLSEEETREVVRALLAALETLHARGLAHGAVAPRNIVAVAGAVKISCDDLHRIGEAPQFTAEADVRGVGLAIYEMLTQRREPAAGDLQALPAPFREIVRGCLQSEGPWPLRRIASALDPAPDASSHQPAAERPPAPVPVAPHPSGEERKPAFWKYAAGAVIVAGAVVWLIWPTGQASRPSSPPVSVTPAPAVAAPAPGEVPKDSPAPRSEEPAAAAKAASIPPAGAAPEPAAESGPRIWRVVVYTYARREDAAREVRRIQRRWPESQPEIFALNETGPPYFVSLGGRMTRAEALQLEQKALAKGFPRDTFVRNFSR